jgi:Xaa-Pro aminopeptidase
MPVSTSSPTPLKPSASSHPTRTLLGAAAGASRAEMERRWSLVRKYLRERSIDALIAVSGEINLSGVARWLTDAPHGAYRIAVAFYADDLMTVIEHGAAGQIRTMDGTSPQHPGVGEVITVSQFPSVEFTQKYEAELLVTALKRRGCRSIALVNGDAMPFRFRTALCDGMGDEVHWHDATPFIDRAKAVKSQEEIALIQAAAAIQDAVFAATITGIRPGMRNFEIVGHGYSEVHRRGGSNGVILFGSGVRGREPAVFAGPLSGDRHLSENDAMTLLVESGSPAGYIVELGRNLVFGRADTAQVELHATLVEAQAATLRLLVPGARPSEIFRAHNNLMLSLGLQKEQRLYSHGQGYDMIERPLIREDEDMPLEVGMCLAVHPNGVLGGYFGFVCDNFLIEQAGARAIHATPQSLVEL